MVFVKDFNELGKNDISEAGGKGANLGELTTSGITVPDGFVVTVDAYRTFLRENGLDDYIEKEIADAGNDPEKLTAAADRIRQRIRSAKLPGEIRGAINEICAKKWTGNTVSFAVRSSATAEDLSDASFAGQQETYLNIKGTENLYESILECYGSLWGRRAVIYRKNSGYNDSSAALAAVVQEMVESETAGVLFTANPVNGNTEELQINASFGLGESVVSGRVTPDEYVCSRDGKVLRRVIGTKETEIVYNETGTGTRTLDVSAERRRGPALTDEEISELVRQGILIEELYGCPMDIEWAVANETVYILQARAITTLNTDENSIQPTEEDMLEARKAAASFKGASLENMVFLLEKMPFVYTHLDDDFGNVIGQVKNEIFSDIGLKLDANTRLDDNGIQYLPDGKKGVTKRIFHIFSLLKNYKNSSWIFQKIRESSGSCKEFLAKTEAVEPDMLSFNGCIKELDRLREYIRQICYDRFMYAFFPAFLQGEKAKKAVRKADPEWSSAEMTLDLDYRTAVIARDQAVMAEKLSADTGFVKDALSGMSYQNALEKYPELGTEMDAFLKKHGYKSDYNCYCIHARTWNEDPERLYQVMLPQLRAVQDQASKEAGLTIGEVRKKVRGTLKQKDYEAFLVNLDIYRECHVLREESQYCWEGIYEKVRGIIRRMETFVASQLEDAEDLQYLSFSEIRQLKDDGGKVVIPEELMEKIRNRSAHHPEAVRKWNAARKALLERAASVSGKKNAGDKKDVLLSGIGGSAGTAEGPVTVVRSPAEFGKLHKGDVLVCPYTDPEWTALFSLASAVVADTGGTLSHAAIVAREYGIPAVLGVGFGTKMLHDGDRIRVDGDNGTVSANSSI